MIRPIISAAHYRAEVDALLASKLGDNKRRVQGQFLSCLRPPGLFGFASRLCGLGPTNEDGPTGLVAMGQFHHDLCAAADSAPEKALWLLPRGHLKSTLLTECEALRQCLYYWPDQQAIAAAGGQPQSPPRIGIVSWSADAACEFLDHIRQLCARPEMVARFGHALWPGGAPQGTAWNSEKLVFKNGASIRAWGLKSLPTGRHASQIYADDIVTKENVNTGDLLREVKERFGLLHSVADPGARFWVTGTHYHHADLYTDLRASQAWQPYVRTCYKADGSPAFPELFTTEHLAAIREEQGPYIFSCQYLLNPISEDEQVFRPEWIKLDATKDTRDGVVTIAVDPAISEGESACYTAITVVISKRQGGDVHRHVAYALRQRMDASATIDAIMTIAERWNPVEIGIEAIQYQASLLTFLEQAMRKRGRWWKVTGIKGHGGKTKFERIRALQPHFARGLVHLLEDQSFITEELLTFPKGKYCDTIDSLSMHLSLDAFHSSAAIVDDGDVYDWTRIANKIGGKKLVAAW